MLHDHGCLSSVFCTMMSDPDSHLSRMVLKQEALMERTVVGELEGHK